MILEQLGSKDFSIEQLPNDSYIHYINERIHSKLKFKSTTVTRNKIIWKYGP